MSLLDYPGKVASVIFTNGCNFRCGFCHNPLLVLPPFFSRYKKEEILSYLSKREGKIEAVVITGGEPILQKDLLDFIKEIKKMNLLVKLDSNGYLPDSLRKIIEFGGVDYLAMDIKAPLEKYPLVCGTPIEPVHIKTSIKLIIQSGLSYEFRSTLVKGLHELSDIYEMAKLVQGAELYYLQRFRAAPQMIDMEFQNKKTFRFSTLREVAKDCEQWVKKCEVRE